MHPQRRRLLELKRQNALAASGRLRIEFGQPDPLDQPGGYRYEISADDRATFEAALRDTASEDLDRQLAARGAITAALRLFPVLGPLFAFGGEVTMNMLGFGVVTNVDAGAGGQTFTGAARWMNGSSVYPGVADSVVTSVSWSVDAGGNYTATWNITNRIRQWEAGLYGGSSYEYTAGSGAFGIENGGGISGLRYIASRPGTSPWGPPPAYAGVYQGATLGPVGDNDAWVQRFSAVFAGRVDNKACYRLYVQNAVDPEYAGWGSGETNDKRYFGPDCLPTEPGSSFDKSNEPFAGLNHAFSALPGELDPASSDLTPDQAHDFINSLKDSPWYQNYPPGTNPGDPGNWNSPDPGAGASNPPVVGGHDGPGGGQITLPPGYDPGDPSFDPGNPICFVQDGVKKCGKIKYRHGPRIGHDKPPHGDQRFQKPWCKPAGTPITDMMKELAQQLGLSANLVIEPGCDKKWPGGCFPKGMNKLDALWKLEDTCGYGVWDPPGVDPPHIGPITPVDVFWTYHENDTLIDMQPYADSTELYRKVIVTKIEKSGRPFSVTVTVAGTDLLSDDQIYQRRVPRGTSDADMLDLAHNLADRFALKTKMVTFEVPLNLRLYGRHQVTLKRPSIGFTGHYMVWPDSVEHSYDTFGELWTTKARGAQLSVERYAPYFDYIP